jgi:hypothetical protein
MRLVSAGTGILVIGLYDARTGLFDQRLTG